MPPNKHFDTYVDESGYLRDIYGKLIHREIAYRQIYLNNRDKYPLPFSEYIVHHKDENKLNNSVDNLQIIIQVEHREIHDIPNVTKKKAWKNHYYLDCHRKINHEGRCSVCKMRSIEEKKHGCIECGRLINHRGRCLRCNTMRKRK